MDTFPRRPGWLYGDEKTYHETFRVLVVRHQQKWWVYMADETLQIPGDRPFHRHGFQSKLAAQAWGEAWARLLGR